MTDKKISQLTGATTPLAGTEVLPIVQGGSTVKVSAADITAGRSISSAGASLDGAVIINESGADVDFRVEGDTEANLFYADASTNRIGIGTSSPSSRLHINSGTSDQGVLVESTDTRALIGFKDDTTVTNPLIGGAADDLVVRTGNAESMRVTSAGLVGIGTSSPSSLLNLLSSTADTLLLVQSTFAGGDARLGLTADSAGVSQIRFGDEASENVGMLTYTHADNSMKFRTNAQDRMFITSGGEVYIAGSTDQGAYNLQVNGTGVWGAGAYVNGSDERVKNEITPIASALGVVEKLNPVTYRYKESWSKDQSIQTGFIAQELLTALEGQVYVDGVVQQNEPESYYSVAYQNIIPILTKAIQELKAELDDVKAKIAPL
jgi:hypothetical protein